jgi:hypothetical protein
MSRVQAYRSHEERRPQRWLNVAPRGAFSFLWEWSLMAPRQGRDGGQRRAGGAAGFIGRHRHHPAGAAPLALITKVAG